MRYRAVLARISRSALALSLATLIVACSSAGPPHSDYFVVFFAPHSAEPLPEGRSALARASADAARGSPDAVLVTGYLSADGTDRELSEQRMRAVETALAQAGIPQKLLRRAPETVGPQAFSELGNGVIVQIERGELPKPSEEPAKTE